MIRRSTVVYILILVVLAGAYYYVNTRQEPADETTSTPEVVEETRYVFTEEDGIPTSIHITAKTGEVVEVARDADNAWKVIQPMEAAAEQGASEAAASQVASMPILESIPEIDLDLVGVQDPGYVVTIKFNNGKERVLHVGTVTPTESGYYVQEASGSEVLIVSKSSLDALLGMLTFPPYLETPTPEQLPAEMVPTATP